ncbi:ATP-grasp domain-containing protein [Xylanibacillus composti]|uniref:Carbamoyl phosphate synthase n=1 Tax=Xylanibacillus composti TaxID=1572762 RepID=A0A8J4M4V9_9BACL|nr:ATP-grasp domain-containing protein [Xylanibacillus composti]MDT9725943.1 ATP-grasp domain-containing protein [Xylanibacillus composti]GIQ71256.1 carbamoyl phosphate synthase [Xylanibacillus composti]
MGEKINILILSCGTRNKIVQYFKNELAGKGMVMAADSSPFAPALYDADKYFIVPTIDDNNYLETILQICSENEIKGVLSLIDPELSIIAKNRKSFLEIGTIPIVSEYEVTEMCFNKYSMYQYLVGSGFNTMKSFIDKEQFILELTNGNINFPVFVKPIKGSASLNLNKASSLEEVDMLFERYNDLMIQELMKGKEYGIDVYIDMFTREPVSMFAKEKLKMRAGETDKSRSIKDEELFNMIYRFVEKTGLIGPIDIDIFKQNGQYYISEINPRFGGGYPHAYECGVNFPSMIVNNLLGEQNRNQIGQYKENIFMMKYNDVKIIAGN